MRGLLPHEYTQYVSAVLVFHRFIPSAAHLQTTPETFRPYEVFYFGNWPGSLPVRSESGFFSSHQKQV